MKYAMLIPVNEMKDKNMRTKEEIKKEKLSKAINKMWDARQILMKLNEFGCAEKLNAVINIVAPKAGF